jgi:hypothetical protein
VVDITDVDDMSEYEIKFLDESHLNEVLYLQQIVTENLLDPLSYYVAPAEVNFFCKHLGNKNSVIGVFHENNLIGFHIASFPGLHEDQLGADLGLKAEELSQVAQFAAVAIHPDHRKKRLLTKVSDKHLKVLEEMGYRHICLRIAPNNYPSIKATMANGFVIKRLKVKYNKLLRYIFHLDFKKSFKQPRYSVRIPHTDIESQNFIISLGFYGYDVLKNDNDYDIVFGWDESRMIEQ